MSYKIKGGKLSKHRASERGWTRLFDAACPAAFISRPEHRTLEALRFLPAFTAEVARRVEIGEPSLCFNEAHEYEFRTVPDVFAVAKLADDAPPFVMGVCPDCAKLSDAELYSIMRRQFQKRGLGSVLDPDHAAVEIEIPNVGFIEAVPGVQIGVALSDKSESPHDCEPATALIAMLRAGKLPRFMAFRHGVHNCHAIVGQLYLDFKDLGIAEMFSFKRGTTPLLASPADPDGSHSWIEADGWAIETSGGAVGNPIFVRRVADYYKQMKLANVREVTPS